uniref:Papilin n=1 Tax=Cacopsylla melanoneura TaxID=428564 RepID=A0A8D8QLD2_9HEMI
MPFYFTGCDGNGNNFDSRQACETMCPPRVAQDICLQPAVIGDCANYVLSWYFDSLESRCKQFYYGGCGGNQNNFMTEESCQARCTAGGTAVVVPTAPPQPSYSGVDVCDQPKDVGPCDGNYEQWYYDRDYDRCLSFQYGGCQGNHNRFNDQWSCQERCVKNIPPPDPALTPSTSLAPPQEVARHDLCFLEANPGPCSQQEAAWYFDRNSYRCQSFIYGGCEGNANRFNTEEQCERQCGEFRAADSCNVPVDAGPCKGNFPKFYFDSVTGSCVEFGYGGCQGSANRFSTVQECESVCLRQEEILPVGTNLTEAQSAICRLPAAYGSCTENHKRFYYDERRGTCIAFGYSGCGGNLNRFTSATECLQYCAPQTQNEVDPSPSPSPQPEDPCASATAECRSVFNCQYGVERWLNQHGCERCRCNDPCANDHPGCPSDSRCAVDPVRNPDSRDTQYIAVCRPLNKEGECRPQPLNVCADNCHDDADCTGQAKCCPNECGMACSTLIDSTTTTTSTQTPYPLYSPTQYAPDTPSPPQFYNESEPNVEAEEGNFVTLRCIAIGFPVPVYTWSKGEVRIDGSDGHFKLTMDGILQIVGLVRQDAGIYVCMAANGVGNPLRKEFNVVVKQPVERPASVIGEDSTAVMVRLGRPSIVPCYAIGYPRPAITWWHQNDLIPLHNEHYDVNKNILTIRQMVPERLGAYTCQAYNGLGKAVSWTVHLQSVPDSPDDPNAIDYSGLLSSAFPQSSVLTTASTTTTQATSPFVYEVPVKVNVTLPQLQFGVGADISIPCDVDGHPVPQVFWYKDGGIIENDGVRYRITESNRLHIYHANATDSGEYRCYASNPYSSDSGSVSIQVEGIYIHPHCVDKPLFANCHLIVSGHLCNHKYYGGFCCESCTRAGQLPSRGPHLKRATEEDSGPSRSKRSLVSRLFDW